MSATNPSHYMQHEIEPIEYIMRNEMEFFEGNIVKYATRWKTKGGVQDLDKIIHYAQMLKEMHVKKERKSDNG